MTAPLPNHPFKSACGLIKAGSQKGTGYLIAPDRVATCWHVVKDVVDGRPFTIDFHGTVREARVLAHDRDADAAVVTLTAPLDGIPPLRIAESCRYKAAWDGYGYPGAAGEAGVPIEGIVTDPEGRDDRKLAAIVLRSPEVAAGMATAVHGFSGSPVLVGGAVIGHLKRIIQDPNDPGRPAFGLLWATPAREVLRLLGAEPAAATAEPETPPPAEPAPAAGRAVIAHRAADRRWTLELAARLEGAGCTVTLVEQEPATPAAAAAFTRALDGAAAVALVASAGWVALPYAADVIAACRARVAAAPCPVAILAVDDAAPPAAAAEFTRFDCRGAAGAEGAEVHRLVAWLNGHDGRDATAERVRRSEAQATDELVRAVRAAAAADATRVFALWRQWHEARLPAGAAALLAAEALVERARPDLALVVLEHATGVRASQLRALALAKTGHRDEAIQLLAGLRSAGQLDAETGGLLAGRYKEKWQQGGNRAFLQSAFDVYAETGARTGDSYPRINAAALALPLGRNEDSRRLAQEVFDQLSTCPPLALDAWKLATLGEACLLLGDLAAAARWYGQAVARDPTATLNIAAMRRQARADLAALSRPSDALDAVLPVPRVAACTGHMTDAPGRPEPRFPQAKVGAVRRSLRDRLDGLGVGFGFSSAARGTDLLFIEEVVRRGGKARVLLPFPREDFARLSVGPGWDERFARVLDDPNVETAVLLDRAPADADLPGAFRACDAAVLREATAMARRLDEEPVLIAVWDGRPGDGAGGTADAVMAWEDEGYPVERIDITTVGGT